MNSQLLSDIKRVLVVVEPGEETQPAIDRLRSLAGCFELVIWSSVTGHFVKHIVQILLALDYSGLYAISSCCNKPYTI